MYDWGSSTSTRNVNLSGGYRSSTAVGRRAFLQQTRERREQRGRQRQQQQSQQRIAAAWRAFRCRQHHKQLCRDEFDRQEELLLLQDEKQQAKAEVLHQQQQHGMHRVQARRISFCFDPCSAAHNTRDGERLLAAAAILPPPTAVPPAGTTAEDSSTCALHVAVLRALSLHYRNLVLLQHSTPAGDNQQRRHQKKPPLLLVDGDVRFCYGWRGSALAPAGQARFGLRATRQIAAAAAAASGGIQNTNAVSEAASSSVPLLQGQCLKIQIQQRKQHDMMQVLPLRTFSCCFGISSAPKPSPLVGLLPLFLSVITADSVTPAFSPLVYSLPLVLLLAPRIPGVCIYVDPLEFPSFVVAAADSLDEALASLEELLFSAADAATDRSAAAAATAVPAVAAFPAMRSAGTIVSAASAAEALHREAPFLRSKLEKQVQERTVPASSTQQREREKLPHRRQLLEHCAAEVLQLNSFLLSPEEQRAQQLPQQLFPPSTAPPDEVVSALAVAAVAAFARSYVRGIVWGGELLTRGLASASQDSLHALQLLTLLCSPQLRRQLVVLTEGWAVDAFFTAAQAAPPTGLSDLLQLYLPPDMERSAALSEVAGVTAEETTELESDSESEAEDQDSTANIHSHCWEHKYSGAERLILNALSVSTPLPLRLLRAIKTFMTDDSELLEETGEDRIISGNGGSSVGFSLRRSDLRWLLLTLNRLAWLLLRAACASACPQQQQQQQGKQEFSAFLPVPLGASNKSSSSGRRGCRRDRLWQLVPGVLRELLDLNGRVSLVTYEELVLPDGPASLIMSAAGGQRLPALWECLVWCMRGGDAAAAAAVASPGNNINSSNSAAGATTPSGRGHLEMPLPSFRLSNLPTRLLASSLVYVPHTIAFQDRLAVFYQLLAFELEDGLSALLNGDIMRGFQVEFITAEGTPEAGIDGGGLLKELIVELSRRAFDPAYGLFNTCSDNTLFPNPSVELLHSNFAELFVAMGKLVGKAVFEGILIEPQLNRVFLKLLLRRPCRLDDIKSLDPSVHRSLMLLKKYTGDATELSLTFSIMRSEFGSQEEVDLIPNGRNIPVTNGSKLRYVQLMSEYKCVRQIQHQTEAFLRGLSYAVPLQWLQMFSAEELQHLVSGTSEGFDVEDLRSHASYSGGFSESSPPVLWLWELLGDMADSERSSFLMFVTSCSRAPLRGFGSLSPPFTIHRVPDTSRLPTSSTCVNLLKLPAYNTRQELRDKLRGAIGGTEGFGLS
ncbi:ubiquitin-transferase domain-containing protein [Cyclospora cayetanensis]|uniref:HECT-type E3 ubiquitin transferase n=1 Tax=Cyclospora cayetanensis TaxID=88456 RepID=A0A1D3CWE9_9EIME|nr:ubiquitin-transferase domain-containing protein [Cyclospora cayetanensis]